MPMQRTNLKNVQEGIILSSNSSILFVFCYCKGSFTFLSQDPNWVHLVSLLDTGSLKALLSSVGQEVSGLRPILGHNP